MLEHRASELATFAWGILGDDDASIQDRLHAAAISAVTDPGSSRWDGVADRVSGWLVQAGAYAAARWLPLLQPVTERLSPSLLALYSRERDSPTGEIAASLLAEINAADPGFLLGLAREAGPRQLPVITEVLSRDAATAEAALRRELSMPVPADAAADPVRLARERSRLCVALLLMGRPAAVWPHLVHQPAPELRSRLVHDIGPGGVDWRVLKSGLETETDPGIVAALVAAMGAYDGGQLPASVRSGPLRTRLEDLFANHPDTCVRSSAGWLLRRWGMEQSLATLDAANRSVNPVDDKHWYVTRNGDFTMSILPSPIAFTMGSPDAELRAEYARENKRPTNESRHPERIERTVAVATKQVTYDQFMTFAREMEVANKNLTPGGWENPVSRTGGAAMSFVSLKEAMLYCWWFTKKEGIPDQEQCYDFEGKRFADADPRTREGYLLKGGYRIPTEAEWEYACRGGTTTRRYFGSAIDILPQYGWFNKNADEHARSPGLLLPNSFGLFDMLGNLTEWCQEPYQADYRSHPTGSVISVEERQHHGQPAEGRWRVFRGGSFYHGPGDLRASWRNRTPYPAHPHTGFRIVRTIKGGAPADPGNVGLPTTNHR
jgi:formylglycine-generating enzyme required for sulfatase activity